MLEGKLIVVQGATGVGKTAMAVAVASSLGCSVISADSRQFYREMTIGTAVPSAEELSSVKHYFIQDRSVTEPLNAGTFADEALDLLEGLFQENPVQVMAGGSGLYVNALVNGIDDLPSDADLRIELSGMTLEELQEQLRIMDPEYYSMVDLSNRRRVMRAVEVCRLSGTTYTSLRKGGTPRHGMQIVNIALDRPRSELYGRIEKRVDMMVGAGLLKEAESVIRYRELPPLCTVGYRELFSYMDGDITLERAVELIKQNTRRYAKRQLTWLRADHSVKWYPAEDTDAVLGYLHQ